MRISAPVPDIVTGNGGAFLSAHRIVLCGFLTRRNGPDTGEGNRLGGKTPGSAAGVRGGEGGLPAWENLENS